MIKMQLRKGDYVRDKFEKMAEEKKIKAYISGPQQGSNHEDFSNRRIFAEEAKPTL